MRIAVQWSTPVKLRRLAVLWSAWALAVWLNSATLVLTAIALCVVEMARGTRVDITGGGFRPIRVSDYIDEAASDELDAWEAEQARKQAQWNR